MRVALLMCVLTLSMQRHGRAETCGIVVSGDAVEVGCLPALSRDRQTVAVPIVDPDGARGYPNLLVRFVPVVEPGKPHNLAVVSVDEWDRWSESERPAKSRERIAAVDQRLGAGFIRLRALQPPQRTDASGSFKLSLGGYDLVGHDGTVSIARGGTQLGSVRAPKSGGKGECRGVNWPFLAALYVDGGVAVLRFDYHGNDACLESTPAWSVVALAGNDAAAMPAADAAAANDRGMKAYRARKWPEAVREFRAAIAADPGHVKSHYNLACVAALAGDRATAVTELGWLSKSADPAAKEKLQKSLTDPDLASIRDDDDVRALLGLGPVGKSTERLWLEEAIGPLKIGMSAAEVTTALGPPTTKSPVQNEAATGMFVSTWEYPGVSVILQADKRKGAAKLGAIDVKAPSKLGARGIAVGATRAQLARAFPKTLWDADSTTDERVVIGSIYGGIIFSFDKERVSEIFVGAAAE